MSEKRRYGILPLLGIVLLIFLLMTGTASAAEIEIETGNITIVKNGTFDSLDIKVDGTSAFENISFAEMIIIKQSTPAVETKNIVVVDGNGINEQIQITIENVNISGVTHGTSAFSLQNGANVKLILSGDNILTGGTRKAGLEVPDGCEITISSLDYNAENGKLNATGGNDGGSGIGSNFLEECGIITIKDCRIISTGGPGNNDGGGSGIGSGGGKFKAEDGSTGLISIQNSIVTATGGKSGFGGGGSGIGSGGGRSSSNIDSGAGGSVSTITIEDNCVIYATGGKGGGGGGSGIGSGGGGTNTGGTGCNGGNGGSVDTIMIKENCEIYATGGNPGGVGGNGAGGSGIGTGGGGGGGGGSGGGNGGSVSTIIIEDNCVITTTGGDGMGIDEINGGGSGIGSGGAGVGGNGGLVTSIKISGTGTDIIVVSGGIGRGARESGKSNDGAAANVIIESGNVLILDQPETAKADFKNSNADPVYPISFTVKASAGPNLPNSEIQSGTYSAMTRANAFDRLGSVTLPDTKYYEDGSVTMWLPESIGRDFIFSSGGYKHSTKSVDVAVTTLPFDKHENVELDSFIFGEDLELDNNSIIQDELIITVVNKTHVNIKLKEGTLQQLVTDPISINQKTPETVTSNTVIVNGNGVVLDNPLEIQIDEINVYNSSKSAFSLQNKANVKLILSGDNYLTGGTNSTTKAGQAGLEVPDKCKITISSLDDNPEKGSLTATGGIGDDGQSNSGGGSGIGSNGHESCGIIMIQNSFIISKGGAGNDGGGSGIGSGGGDTSTNAGAADKIIIQNSFVTAIGGSGSYGGGGSGIGSGGGGFGDSGRGGSVTTIIVNDSSVITATGGRGRGSGGSGSGIGSGGGGFGGSGTSGGSITDSINISGTGTDVIVISGGVGRGAPGFGKSNDDEKANVIIESGNVLILNQPSTAKAIFKNSNDDPVSPISFTVTDSDGNGLSGALIKSGDYSATTREDATDRINAAGLASDFDGTLFADGTATLWLPVGEPEFNFSLEDYSSVTNSFEIEESTDSPRVGEMNSVKLALSGNQNGGKGFGNGKVVENETPSQPGQTDSNQSNQGFDNEKDVTDNSQTQEPPEKTSFFIWAVIGGILIICIVAGVYFYRKNK